MITTFLAGLLLTAPANISVRVDGEGYMRFVRDGRIVYAKQISLGVDRDVLAGPNGASMLPEVRVPQGAKSMTISLDGFVSVVVDGKSQQIARIVLAMFPKTSTLTPRDGYLIAVDRATLQNPGDDLAGVIRIVGAPTPAATGTTGTTTTQGKAPIKIAKTNNEPAYTGKPDVRVNPISEVAGPRFTLGEIATIKASPEVKAKLESIDMGDVPTAGIPRPISGARLLYLFQQAGFKPNEVQLNVPPDAKVAVQVQKVTNEQFADAARQAVNQQLGVQLVLTNSQNFPDFIAPLGELKLEASRPQRGQNGFTVLVTVLVNGKKINSRLMSLTADAAAAAIKAGDPVRIYIRRGGATIEVSGKARSAGYVGQQITVVSSTGSVHQATVLSGSEVEVKL